MQNMRMCIQLFTMDFNVRSNEKWWWLIWFCCCWWCFDWIDDWLVENQSLLQQTIHAFKMFRTDIEYCIQFILLGTQQGKLFLGKSKEIDSVELVWDPVVLLTVWYSDRSLRIAIEIHTKIYGRKEHNFSTTNASFPFL